MIDIQEVKTIQIEVLSAIHSFCEANSIHYSLACGTLLGAVRHEGYIPWDDDIDIYLLRKDYIQLISKFPTCYEEKYELISLERDARWDRSYAKAYDNRTVVEENAYCNVTIGVGIDIYPIDDVPDSESDWKRYDKFRRVIQKAMSIKKMKYKKERGLVKNIEMFLLKAPVSFINSRTLAEKADRLSQMHNEKGYHYVFECCQGLLQKNRFAKSAFASLSNYSFEGHMFWGFSDFDAYLSCAYGNYMQLPPIEKRVIHHDYIAYWKH